MAGVEYDDYQRHLGRLEALRQVRHLPDALQDADKELTKHDRTDSTDERYTAHLWGTPFWDSR